MEKCFLKIGSNLIWPGRESQAGSSRADFANKVRIALREMRESNYLPSVILNLKSIINCYYKFQHDSKLLNYYYTG